MKVYGVINNDNVLIDISLSEIGTKRYATNNQYNKIGYRIEYNAIVTHEKIGNKWHKVN